MSRLPRSPVSVDPELLDDEDGTSVEETTEETDEGSEETSEETTNEEAPNASDDRLNRLEQNQQVLSLLADPDIAAVVAAKRAGKRVNLTTEDTVAPVDPLDEIVKDLPEDDPARELIGKVGQLMESKYGQVVKTLETRLRQIERQGEETVLKEVTSQIEQVRQENKDFDRYRTAMMEISKTNPNLGVKDLYIIAKSRAGELRQAEQIAASEKPTAQPRPAGAKAPRQKAPVPAGRKGFDELLRESLNKQNFDDSKPRRR
jgi:hypothetical protein